MSCLRTCFDKKDKNFGYEDCLTCKDNDSGRNYKLDEQTAKSNVDCRVILPPVLDVCCGAKMMWFDKHDKRAIYHDKRFEEYEITPNAAYPNGTTLKIEPDIQGDFTELQFKDESFLHIVFDPPHLKEINNPDSVIRKTYGQLFTGWEEHLRLGFEECFRVLKPGGTLVFKWCESEIPLSKILSLTKEKPLYGQRGGTKNRTHWVVFLKAVI